MGTTEALVDLFASSGLEGIESRMIDIPLAFEDFNDFLVQPVAGNLQTLAVLRCGSIKSRSEGKSFGRYERANFIRGTCNRHSRTCIWVAMLFVADRSKCC